MLNFVRYWLGDIFDTNVGKCSDIDVSFVHVHQQGPMDCGPACIRMVHRWASQTDAIVPCNEEVPLWTIDMYAILREMNVCIVKFYTSAIDMKSHHHNMDWYKEENGNTTLASVHAEFERVQSLFIYGIKENWDIINVCLIMLLLVLMCIIIILCIFSSKEQLSDDELISVVVHQRGVAIVLVNGAELSKYTKTMLTRVADSLSGDGKDSSGQFRGHYVLVIGRILMIKVGCWWWR